ncbi:hypothetical protein [Methyloceanibacter sp.]|uniref:hypothetical protein n=1 Tax=Methyloceanibacter sp. TaxID=1965321 RepID=UPI002C9EAF52|nr:hypothetical protein [Methyloceanibacter sp.]HML92948.1 hypothetical protein [Methyloceanibacter sp.]
MQERSPVFAQNIREFWRSGAPPAAPLFFLAFVVAGALFIIFGKLSGLPNWFVVLVPVAIMLTYAGLAYFVRPLRLRDDQTGDNLYYMGFIFTLTSLAVALYQFEPNTGFDQVVRNFGVAISSTITGIALRVIFNQMRQDPVEVEQTARQELAEASRRVCAELYETVLAFNHFRTATFQSIEEGQEELCQRLLAHDQEMAGHAAKHVEDGAAKTGASLHAFALAIDGMSRRMDGEAGKLAGPLAALNARLETVQTPDKVVEVKLEPLVQSLSAAVAEFNAQSQAHSQALTRAVEALAGGKGGKRRSRWKFWRR